MLFTEYANLNCHEICNLYHFFSLSVNTFDMNPVSLAILLYFAILVLDFKKDMEISNAKIIILKLKSLVKTLISLLIFLAKEEITTF